MMKNKLAKNNTMAPLKNTIRHSSTEDYNNKSLIIIFLSLSVSVFRAKRKIRRGNRQLLGVGSRGMESECDETRRENDRGQVPDREWPFFPGLTGIGFGCFRYITNRFSSEFKILQPSGRMSYRSILQLSTSLTELATANRRYSFTTKIC